MSCSAPTPRMGFESNLETLTRSVAGQKLRVVTLGSFIQLESKNTMDRKFIHTFIGDG